MGKPNANLNNIKRFLIFLLRYKPDLKYEDLVDLGFNKITAQGCLKNGIYCLHDLNLKFNQLYNIYNFNNERLVAISHSLRKVARMHLTEEQFIECLNFKCIGQTVRTRDSYTAVSTLTPHEQMLEDIEERSINCCLCITLKELLRITETEFIKLMRKKFKSLTGHDLEKSRTKSWRDEYKQFTKYFIPIIRKNNKNDVNFPVIFEYKLPLELTDLESKEYVYSDAIIVGEEGIVVLEFKQMNSDGFQFHAKQALKYMHRLRYHKVSCRQHKRYTYVVYTEEKDDKVYSFGNKKDFWFGNPKGVAKDLCTQFFDSVNYCDDIGKWLSAGFWEKRSK